MKPTTDTHGTHAPGWIGVDLDCTLAVYHGWQGPEHIGAPIEPMVARVRQWIAEGREVRILTARVYPGKADHLICRAAIIAWLKDVFGQEVGGTIPITHAKDPAMLELWDDRVVQVIPNTGKRADSLASRLMHRFWLLLCRLGNHDWRDGIDSRCRTCGARDTFSD